MILTPAEYIIEKFGGVRATARALNRNASSVSRWQKTGLIPSGLHSLILIKAKEMRLNIRPAHLIFGAKVKYR